MDMNETLTSAKAWELAVAAAKAGVYHQRSDVVDAIYSWLEDNGLEIASESSGTLGGAGGKYIYLAGMRVVDKWRFTTMFSSPSEVPGGFSIQEADAIMAMPGDLLTGGKRHLFHRYQGSWYLCKVGEAKGYREVVACVNGE